METTLTMSLMVLAMLPVCIAFACLLFQNKMRQDVRQLFSQAKHEPGVVRSEMLAGLPEPVQRYLNYSGIVGKPFVATLRLKQHGSFRTRPDRMPMQLTAEQYFSADPPGYIWNATFKLAGLPLIRACDAFQDGQGSMHGDLLALFPVIESWGERITQGAMVRYLAEMLWFPSAFLGRNATWQPRDQHSAEVTLEDGSRKVTATMYFDDEGRLVNTTAMRYGEVDGIYTLNQWSVPVELYGEFEGLRMPVAGKVIWNYAAGDFAYFNWNISQIEFDPAAAY